MIQIIIYVNGGVVQNVVSNSEGVEVMIVDYDDEKCSNTLDRQFTPVETNKNLFDRTVIGKHSDASELTFTSCND